MADDLSGVLPSIGALGTLVLISLYLTFSRAIVSDETRERHVVRIATTTVVLQVLHFTEELSTGFYVRFPELLGFPPIPVELFVGFNVAWIIVWIVSIFGIRAQLRLASFPIWFLGIASLANGVAHPMFSVAIGGYFPGLLTSPLVGVAGWVLVRALASYYEPAAGVDQR